MELNKLQEAIDPVSNLLLGGFADLQSERHVLPDCHVTKQRIVLEYEADSSVLYWYTSRVFPRQCNSSTVRSF